MSKLIVNDEMRSKLKGLNGEAELCDATGMRMGWFLPDDIYMRLMYDLAKVQFSDEEELKRAREEPGGMTTAEVLAHLKSLDRPEKSAS
jgi:hypothetical protein